MRAARTAAGMSQTDLAALTGASQATISYIETYEIQSSNAVLPICRALKMSPPHVYYVDELERRWVEIGSDLRRMDPGAFNGLLLAAEAIARH